MSTRLTLQVRRSLAAITIVAATLGLAGCTPEGLMVFGRTASAGDIPSEAARSVVPKAADDDFRLLGTVDDAKYYAVVLKGAADPWCLLQVDHSGEAAAACGSEPRLVSYSSANIVALSNDRPDESQDWQEIGTSFWVAASR